MDSAIKACVRDDIENLAFVNWQLLVNEKAYSANVITAPMYEYAKGKLERRAQKLAQLHYTQEVIVVG